MSDWDTRNTDTVGYRGIVRSYEHADYSPHLAVRMHTRLDHLRNGYGIVLSIPPEDTD